MEKQQTYWGDDWYIGPCSRTDAEHALHLANKDGAFLVRDCSLNSNSEPLVLSVYHEKIVYNVKIRFIEDCGKYALGTGQRSNEMFDSVTDIIKFHSIFPIVLISGKISPGASVQRTVCSCVHCQREMLKNYYSEMQHSLLVSHMIMTTPLAMPLLIMAHVHGFLLLECDPWTGGGGGNDIGGKVGEVSCPKNISVCTCGR
uniref:SH2 domain-containing protein n=1 Tax=Neogobius melanostomus TaxID=47308 RepID=A0A8C6UMW3_9GOBI